MSTSRTLLAVFGLDSTPRYRPARILKHARCQSTSPSFNAAPSFGRMPV